MTSYVLDTDHVSLYQRAHPILNDRVRLVRQSKSARLAITIVTVEEQCAGRLAQIRKATRHKLINAYSLLNQSISLFSEIEVLEYGLEADQRFYAFRRAGIRIGTQDLRIASIVLSYGGILCTRNRRDFDEIPGLLIEDWSIQP
ncbi:MAG: type II toxin-antitoxin system VapC family toxin [Plectolyngbya sp. WJT66-NPBG17]|jgi:tRNA(fMet)-specific endonuclease VapC|nr:type II toxin-antitoxin system VapC family toxin [Plectolyngbya sp. WJT66-NPBG17]MBW4528404.1 type II toxin-antitoxin system VapC family toxin [Phormidium tanganyikae FI6-MK23]